MKIATNLSIALLMAGVAAGSAAQIPGRAPDDPSIVTAEAPRVAPADNASARNSEFLLKALRASLAELRMAELAAQQSYDQKVRDYGTKLKSDHTAHAGEIERLLEPLDVTIPTEPSAEALGQLAALTRLSGEEFDAAFVQMMVWTHTDAIERYGAQTHANPDRSLHDFATRSLPMLREHLALAESLR
jgi:putative membrane protein